MPLQEVQAGDARELQHIADALALSHKVLVVTGAGISTSCGIPDFRSKDGLYNMIPEQCLPTPPASEPSTPSRKRRIDEVGWVETPSKKRQAIDSDDDEVPSSQSSTSSRASRRFSSSPVARMSGKDLFHARVFQRADTTQVFNQFLAGFKQKLKDDVKQTSKTHKFIKALRDGGRLMRCYTQNIDGLEEREGLCVDLARGKGNKRRFMKKHYESPRPEDVRDTDFDGGCEVVQLHGELNRLRCTVCSTEEEWTPEATEILLEGAAPNCSACNAKSEQRQATGKRGLTVGSLRPNIVLYGEEHPQNTLLSPLVPYDIASGPEILIIMGTSLKVFGMQKIIRDFAKAIHGKKNGRVIFVNRTRPAESVWEGVIDDFVHMDCDDWVDDLKIRRKGLWYRQGELDLKETKSASKRKRKSDAVEVRNETSSAREVKVKQNSHISVDIPPVRKSGKSVRRPLRATAAAINIKATTPHHATKWKNQSLIDQSFRNLLSPLARNQQPVPSPLSRSHRARLHESPQAPLFSPLTPSTPTRFRSSCFSPSKLSMNIHEDMNDADEGTEGADGEDVRCQIKIEDDETDVSALISCGNTLNVRQPRTFNGKLIAAQTDGTWDGDEDDGQEQERLTLRRKLGGGSGSGSGSGRGSGRGRGHQTINGNGSRKSTLSTVLGSVS